MALTSCTVNGKSGFKHGPGGTCFTHDGTKTKQRVARYKAITQGLSAGKSGSLFSEAAWWIPRPAESRPDA